MLATLSQNPTTREWEAKFRGIVFASSINKSYLMGAINGGTMKRAKKMGVTRIIETGFTHTPDEITQEVTNNPIEEVKTPEENYFGINERFEIMADYVSMVANRNTTSAIILGEGGLGKTFTVLKTLEREGLKLYRSVTSDDSSAEITHDNRSGYVIIKGYTTAKALFRSLWENRNRIVVFDDTDEVFKNQTSTDLLKAALDSYETRIITWNSEGFGSRDDDLPKSFEFTGGVIFISNMPRHKVPQPIRSRGFVADLSMKRDEIITRMEWIVETDDFLPEFEKNHKIEAMSFIKQHQFNPGVRKLNLRTLVNTTKARATRENWQRMALYNMLNADD
jgi:hypothetical protein